MGQVLIRNLDDSLLEDYRLAARREGRSLEAELRLALARSRPHRARDRAALLAAVQGLIPALPDGEDSTDVIRSARDTNGGRSVDDEAH